MFKHDSELPAGPMYCYIPKICVCLQVMSSVIS